MHHVGNEQLTPFAFVRRFIWRPHPRPDSGVSVDDEDDGDHNLDRVGGE